MCEPQVFGLRAGSSLAKMASDGRAGGPRLGLDTSLLTVGIFEISLKISYSKERSYNFASIKQKSIQLNYYISIKNNIFSIHRHNCILIEYCLTLLT